MGNIGSTEIDPSKESDEIENTDQVCLIEIERGNNEREDDVKTEQQNKSSSEDERLADIEVGTSKDLFRQVNNTMYQIQKSKSTAGLKAAEFLEMEKSQSRSDIKSEVNDGDSDSIKSSKSIKGRLGVVKEAV